MGKEQRLASSETQDAKKGEGCGVTGKLQQNRTRSHIIETGALPRCEPRQALAAGDWGGSAAKDHLRHCRGPAPNSIRPSGQLKKATRVCSHGRMDPNRVMPTLAPQNQPGAYNLPCVTSSAPTIRQQIWEGLLINHFPSENPAKIG